MTTFVSWIVTKGRKIEKSPFLFFLESSPKLSEFYEFRISRVQTREILNPLLRTHTATRPFGFSSIFYHFSSIPQSSSLSKVERRLFFGMLSAVLGTDEDWGCKFAFSSPAHARCPRDNGTRMATPKSSNASFFKFVHGSVQDPLTSEMGAWKHARSNIFGQKKGHIWFDFLIRHYVH